MKTMTCVEFDELLWGEGWYSDIHSEMFHSQSYSSEKVWKAFKSEAEKRKVTLSDEETWSYDKRFYDNYQADSDKGLS